MPETMESWRALSELDDTEAQRAMLARFRDLAVRPEPGVRNSGR